MRPGRSRIGVLEARASEEDHGRLAVRRPLRQPPAKPEAVHPRERHVEQDHRGAPEARGFGCLLGRRGFLDFELVGRQRGPEEQPERRVVVHDEDPAPRRAGGGISETLM